MEVDDRKLHAELLARRAGQVQRGGARAAVLGVNDGLVSTLCIVLGVAGAAAGEQQPVLLAGFAGLVAGAVSMGIGEWISVRAQVELFEGILADVKGLIKSDRPLLEEQLELNLLEAGLAPKTARAATSDVSHSSDHLFDLYTSRVIGINKDELGSPWVAAFSSGALFTFGALASLLPWFFIDGFSAIALSLAFVGIGAVVVGAYVAKSSGRSLTYGAIRQLLIVIAAAIVTYGTGLLFGAVV